MKLTICITHYQEPFEVVRPMLESLRIQRGIDWRDVEILIAQDGKEGILDPSLYAPYNLPIRALNLAKCGISAARNRGMYEAKGEYIMWCDCDDMFQSVFGLHLILDKISAKCPDIISSKFVEENKYIKPYCLVPHENDTTFVHGKVFRVLWLRKQGLKFHEDLTKHEDGVFVSMALTLSKNTEYIQTPFYLWCWNDQSTMRKDGIKTALLKSYPELMAARMAVLSDMKKRGLDIKIMVVKSVMDAYYDFQKSEFAAPENEEMILKALEAFAHLWQKYRDVYKKADAATLGQVMMASRQLAYSKGMVVERMTLSQFLGSISKGIDSDNAE